MLDVVLERKQELSEDGENRNKKVICFRNTNKKVASSGYFADIWETVSLNLAN